MEKYDHIRQKGFEELVVMFDEVTYSNPDIELYTNMTLNGKLGAGVGFRSELGLTFTHWISCEVWTIVRVSSTEDTRTWIPAWISYNHDLASFQTHDNPRSLLSRITREVNDPVYMAGVFHLSLQTASREKTTDHEYDHLIGLDRLWPNHLYMLHHSIGDYRWRRWADKSEHEVITDPKDPECPDFVKNEYGDIVRYVCRICGKVGSELDGWCNDRVFNEGSELRAWMWSLADDEEFINLPEHHVYLQAYTSPTPTIPYVTITPRGLTLSTPNHLEIKTYGFRNQ